MSQQPVTIDFDLATKALVTGEAWALCWIDDQVQIRQMEIGTVDRFRIIETPTAELLRLDFNRYRFDQAKIKAAPKTNQPHGPQRKGKGGKLARW